MGTIDGAGVGENDGNAALWADKDKYLKDFVKDGGYNVDI